MLAAINRMQFLRGGFSAKEMPVRPPWSLEEDRFITQCTRCSDCVSACPQHILVTGRGGFPQVDFSRNECLFCGDCVRNCTTGALQPNLTLAPWSLQPVIEASCLAQQGVECRVCSEVCEARAIHIRLRVGGPGLPEVNGEDCIGCGACVAGCPSRAIRLQARSLSGE